MKRVFILICFLNCASNAQVPELWGMTSSGIANFGGVIFKINGDGTGYTKVFSFSDSMGTSPRGNLLQANNGLLYGMTYTGGANGQGTIFSFDPVNNIYSKLFDFFGSEGGAKGNLIQATDGNLYGMANAIFKFNLSNNSYTRLDTFNGANGILPVASLMQSSSGKLYGMTEYGGSYSSGVIFSLDISNNTYIKLHDFDGTHGQTPEGNLIQANNGKLYGMAAGGGYNSDNGVIFSFDTLNNLFDTLYDFKNATGAVPFGSLLQARNGKLYGMTNVGGGAHNCVTNGCGVLFSYNINTTSYDALFDFDNINGTNPNGSLIQASDGKLYGMATMSGANNGGVIFNFDPNSFAYTKLHDFNGPDGFLPYGDLIELNPALGIKEAKSRFDVCISPNPATTTITITIDENLLGSIAIITDITGRKIQLLNIQHRILNIETSDFPNGIYFITVANDKQSAMRKFVVSR